MHVYYRERAGERPHQMHLAASHHEGKVPLMIAVSEVRTAKPQRTQGESPLTSGGEGTPGQLPGQLPRSETPAERKPGTHPLNLRGSDKY